MSAGFTPGPWPVEQTGDGKRYLVGKGLVEGPNGYEVAEVYSDDCDPAEAKANAHLIAAAPELYEALEFAEEKLGLISATAWTGPAKRYGDIARMALVNVQAALAKARGEQVSA